MTGQAAEEPLPLLQLGPGDRRFELIVKEEGVLPLTEELVQALKLKPGDILSVAMGPATLHLEIFEEFLSCVFETFAPEILWCQVQPFLERTLTSLKSAGALPIPPDLFRLQPGDRVTLQVMQRGTAHELYVFRDTGRAGESE